MATIGRASAKTGVGGWRLGRLYEEGDMKIWLLFFSAYSVD